MSRTKRTGRRRQGAARGGLGSDWVRRGGGRLWLPPLGLLLGVWVSGCPDTGPQPAEQVARAPEVNRSRAAGRPGGATRGTRQRLLGPSLPRPTCEERAYDAARAAALQRVVRRLRETLARLQAIAQRGAAEPSFRKQWPSVRDHYLKRVGADKAAVLQVDPLGESSYAARLSSRLVQWLEVALPASVPASWTARPSGAWARWQRDFLELWGALDRYVRGLGPAGPCGREGPRAARPQHSAARVGGPRAGPSRARPRARAERRLRAVRQIERTNDRLAQPP